MNTPFMLPVRYIPLTALLTALLASTGLKSAHAAFGIADTYGSAIELPGPPPVLTYTGTNVHPGSNEANKALIFPEVINGVVKATNQYPDGSVGLKVDHNGSSVVASPTIYGNVVNEVLISTTIPVGTGFNSYLLHFDPIGNPAFPTTPDVPAAPPDTPAGITTITFDNPIIGLQLFSNGFALQKQVGMGLTSYTGTLEQGDVQVELNGGKPTTYFPGGVNFRGIEEDAFILAVDGNTLMIAVRASNNEIDQIRILTAPTIAAAVPEPAAIMTWAVIAITIGGVLVWKR